MNTSERIKEIAIKISPDYPDIANCDDFECLWAIEGSYEGCSKANDDMHVLTKVMAARCGMTILEMVELSQKIIKLIDEKVPEKEIIERLGNV